MPTAVNDVSNPRLLRAIQAIRTNFDAKNRKEFEDALCRSTLLVEAKRMPAGWHRPLCHRTEKDRNEQAVFTDLRAYLRWKPGPRRGRVLIADKTSDLLSSMMYFRWIDGRDVVINPAGPATLRLHCSGAALLLRNRYPVFIV